VDNDLKTLPLADICQAFLERKRSYGRCQHTLEMYSARLKPWIRFLTVERGRTFYDQVDEADATRKDLLSELRKYSSQP